MAVDGRIDRPAAGPHGEEHFRHRSFPAAGHASIRQIGETVATDAKVLSLTRGGGVFDTDPLPDGARVRILVGTDGGGLEIDAVVADKSGEAAEGAGVRVRFQSVTRMATARLSRRRPSTGGDG